MNIHPSSLNYVKRICFFFLLFCFSQLSWATVIIAQYGDATVTSSPQAGYTYLVPESDPYFTFTAMGGVSSEIQWENGSLNDKYGSSYAGLNPFFGDPETLFFYYGFQLDGAPALTLEKRVIGGAGSPECTEEDEYDSSVMSTFLCGTELFSKIDVSLTATVPVGHYNLQLIHQVVFSTSEILVAKSAWIDFDVEAVPMFEPSAITIFGFAVIVLAFIRQNVKSKLMDHHS